MKSINLEIDLSFLPDQSRGTVSDNWINWIIGGHAKLSPQGADRKERRILGRIIDKIEATKNNNVDLEESEFDVIRDIDEKARFPQTIVKVANLISQRIDEANK